MPLLLAVTLAAVVQPTCSWDNPGHNPYTGGAAAAIDRYTDIPEAVRRTLKRRMEEGQSDDQVSITRDHIAGKNQYEAAIRDMHFGKASMCATVTRSKWAETRNEPGAVYCVDQHCILVPRICGNVSRITRIEPASTAAADRRAREAAEKQRAEAERLAGNAVAIPEIKDLSLSDAPPRDNEVALDEADDAGRQANKDARQRALDAISATDPEHLLTEEELADAADRSRYGAFGRSGVFGDDDYLGPVAAPVPEADTWAMLLVGLGLIGWRARRRARRT